MGTPLNCLDLCFWILINSTLVQQNFRETGEKDVAFKVLYCGICHSDLHMAKNEWGTSIYPLVPGYVLNSVVLLSLVLSMSVNILILILNYEIHQLFLHKLTTKNN